MVEVLRNQVSGKFKADHLIGENSLGSLRVPRWEQGQVMGWGMKARGDSNSEQSPTLQLKFSSTNNFSGIPVAQQ